MKNDRLMLLGSRSLSPDPITIRQIRRARLRAQIATIFCIAGAALLVVGLVFMAMGCAKPELRAGRSYTIDEPPPGYISGDCLKFFNSPECKHDMCMCNASIDSETSFGWIEP
jgi:hypothetical protein